MITAINFAVANVCSAKCVYCPTDRGDESSEQILSFDVFKKVIDEISSEEFQNKNDLNTIRLGENGDMFLNKSILDMFRMVRAKLPKVRIELYNHFTKFKPELSAIFLEEKLMDAVYMNVDGVGENYVSVKHASYEKCMDNLGAFIRKRDELGMIVPISIRALTMKSYVETVRANFDADPGQVPKEILDTQDDYHLVKEELDRLLNPAQDGFKRGTMHMWGERETLAHLEINEKDYSCPMLNRVESEAYISPEGEWYVCCLDSKQEVKIGSVVKNTLQDLIDGDRRKEILDNLHSRDFSKIGGPCKTVHCCQVYFPNPFFSRIMRTLMGFNFIAQKAYTWYKTKI